MITSFIYFHIGIGYGRGSGSSPDSMGAGDTLTGGVSTPSSEALDQVSDLRHSRTLPKRGGVISNNNPASNGLKVIRKINLIDANFIIALFY